jgi:hypothetical protein
MTLDDLQVRSTLLDIREHIAKAAKEAKAINLRTVKDQERRDQVKATRELCDLLLKKLK